MGGREQGEEGREGLQGGEGGLRKGTNEEGMYVWTEEGEQGREEASGGGTPREGATERGRGAREERGRKGDRNGGKLQSRYHEEYTDQYNFIEALGLGAFRIGNPSEAG